MDDIPKNYLLILVLISIISIAFGIISIITIDEKFDGVIVDSEGTILDFGEYLDDKSGKDYFINYINNLQPSNFYKFDVTKAKISPTYISNDGKWLFENNSQLSNFIFSLNDLK